MRSTLVLVGALLCFSGGVTASFTSFSLQNTGTHIFSPLSPEDVQTPPVALLLAGTIQTIDGSAHTLDIAIRDPYAHAQQLLLEVHYDEATQINNATWSDLHPGARVLALVSRAAGPLYLASVTQSKQYE